MTAKALLNAASDGTAVPVGYIGEVIGPISRVKSNSTSLTSGTPVNVGTTTSITLTPGNWVVSGFVGFSPNATASVTLMAASVSKTSATISGGDTECVPTSGEVKLVTEGENVVVGNGFNFVISISSYSVSVSTNTVYYLVGQGSFTGAAATLSIYGSLQAVRIS